jgi:ATP-dependent Lon protease
VRDEVAMTGEVTLTGQVLPIGGLKEKALAAQRNGITTVVAPAQNEADAEEIPEHLRHDLSFVFVDRVPDVLDAALEPPPGNGRAPRTRAPRAKQRPRAAPKARV